MEFLFCGRNGRKLIWHTTRYGQGCMEGVEMKKDYFDKIANHGQLVIISGPNGSGKRSIINQYMSEHPNACQCVGVTTRAKRPYETEGKDYFYISQLEFDRLIRSKQMLEYTYYENYAYGIQKQFIVDSRKEGRNVLINMDVNSAMRVRAYFPDATLIFIMPPTWEDLEERLRKLGTDEEVIEEQLEWAREQIACAIQYDYIIVNDTVDKAVSRIAQIIHGNRYSRNSMREFLDDYIESEIRPLEKYGVKEGLDHLF